jgi:ADP-heptose:LPS heptosyltransferase
MRTYALGDVLQLIPVARQFKEQLKIKNISIFTRDNIARDLKFLFNDITFHSCEILQHYVPQTSGIILNLDGCLEKDHDPNNKESVMHRVDIYFEKLNIPRIGNVNWSPFDLRTHLFERRFPMEYKLPKIGIQIKGSGPIKSLPFEYIKELSYYLANKYQVVLLDYDKNYGFEGNNILNLCGKLNVYECVALLTKLDVCITMDSGMLWLAHSANCPVVTILASTRESERLTLHPLYPNKARSVDITKMIGCQPCFETRQYCKGRMRCMKDFDKKILTEKIESRLQEILGVANG